MPDERKKTPTYEDIERELGSRNGASCTSRLNPISNVGSASRMIDIVLRALVLLILLQRRQTPADSPHFAHILVTNGERCVAISVLIL